MSEKRDLRHPGRVVPPRSVATVAELRRGDRELCHCLECGGQLAALTHGGSCLFCGSAAVVIEAWD